MGFLQLIAVPKAQMKKSLFGMFFKEFPNSHSQFFMDLDEIMLDNSG
jgi:hypothetical protein